MKTRFFISTGTWGVTPIRFLRRLLPGADRTILPSVIGGLAARPAEKVRVRTGQGIQAALGTVGRSLWLLVAALLGFSISGSALAAQDKPWPTTRWQVWPSSPSGIFEERDLINFYEHEMALASEWFQSIGFPPPIAKKKFTIPYWINLDDILNNAFYAILKRPEEDGSVSLGAFYTSHRNRNHPNQGLLNLSRHFGFINPKEPADYLMRAGMVHEMFHGIQATMASQGLYDWGYVSSDNKAGFPSCDDSDRGLDAWLSEGAAAFIQIAWLEHRYGIPRWGHPFTDDYKGRAVWMRYYDQALDFPMISDPKKDFGKNTYKEYCGYGTWYFWYALGDFFSAGVLEPKESSSLKDNEKSEIIKKKNKARFEYIKHIYKVPGPWSKTGVEGVNEGLKNAVIEYEKNKILLPRKYRDGLYYFYPRFVAEYLNDERFYENILPQGSLRAVDESARRLGGFLLKDFSFKDVESSKYGLLHPYGTHAWKFLVAIDEKKSPINTPIHMRFTLFAQEKVNRDNLHLIVNDEVIPRPASAEADYIFSTSNLMQGKALNSNNGYYEFLVRVVNVPKERSDIQFAKYCLRLEVDGYYGGLPVEKDSAPCAGQSPNDPPPQPSSDTTPNSDPVTSGSKHTGGRDNSRNERRKTERERPRQNQSPIDVEQIGPTQAQENPDGISVEISGPGTQEIILK